MRQAGVPRKMHPDKNVGTGGAGVTSGSLKLGHYLRLPLFEFSTILQNIREEPTPVVMKRPVISNPLSGLAGLSSPTIAE